MSFRPAQTRVATWAVLAAVLVVGTWSALTGRRWLMDLAIGAGWLVIGIAAYRQKPRRFILAFCLLAVLIFGFLALAEWLNR